MKKKKAGPSSCYTAYITREEIGDIGARANADYYYMNTTAATGRT